MSQPEPPPVPEVLHRTAKDGTRIKYIIGERMGSGGFAVVYKGEELPAHKPLAIKCIPKLRMQDKRVQSKLVSEVEIHRSLHHPNIVEFRGVFQDDNYVYILLELCANGTVLDVLKKHIPFTEQYTSEVTRQVLHGLVYLHKNRVIHRDLKLQNFLIDSDNVVKVADFGLSAQLRDDDDKRMTMCGTPGYLSPEVIDHHDGQTYSVDIWATGVCAFVMLTGKQPFQSHDKHVTYKKIKHVSYSWPESPKVSDVAQNFVDSALQKDPAKRPNAEQLLQDPFILQYMPQESIPRPLEALETATNGSAQDIPQISLPNYTVRIWWDYSHRYGLAYLLRNHVCGACFNDASRILMTPDENLAQYWDTPQTEQPDIVSMLGIDESPIKKKLLLIKHFAAELKNRAGKLNTPALKINMPTDSIAHVKYWARTREGVLFRMANRDIQANFRDHTKLVIESATKLMYFDSGHGVKQLNLSDLSDKEKYNEVRKRFALVKEMAKHLI